MRYRRRVYRKRKIKIIVITSLCVVAVLAILFVIIGNMLGDKVEARHDIGSSKKNTAAEVSHATVKDVSAYPIPLAADGSTLDKRVANAVKNGYTDICFDIYSDDGSLLYASPAAQALGKQATDVSGLRNLETIVGIFQANNVYSIAVVDAPELEDQNDLIRSAAIGHYAAISAELLRAGVNEVLIAIGEIPVAQYGELITLASEIHRLSPDKGYVGISLPAGVLSSADNDALVASLWTAFDYLAVDLFSGVTPESDIVSDVGTKLGGMLYHLLRYNVRALLPNTADDALSAAVKELAISEGVKSIQVMP